MGVGGRERGERAWVSRQPQRNRNPHGVDHHRCRIAGEQASTKDAERRPTGPSPVGEGHYEHPERSDHEVDPGARLFDEE
jgi:hypothetical protein